MKRGFHNIGIVIPATMVWPNDCPRCGTRMEFAFSPRVHRVCKACATRVQAEECGRLKPERVH